MVAPANAVNSNRNVDRMNRANEEAARKPASAKEGKPRRMDLDAYAAAAERNGVAPRFGALAAEAPPSMESQIKGSIRAVEGERQAMLKLGGEMASAYRSVPILDRSAEVVTGAAAAAFTPQNMAGAAVESVVRWSTTPLERSVDDAAKAAGWVVGGELSKKCDRAKALFTRFSNLQSEYQTVNRQYQSALRAQDFPEINRLAARKDELVPQIKQAAQQLQSAVLAVGQEDKRFEQATIAAAEHMLLAAVSAGWSQAGFVSTGSLVSDVKHHIPHVVQETAVGQVWHRVFGDHE